MDDPLEEMYDLRRFLLELSMASVTTYELEKVKEFGVDGYTIDNAIDSCDIIINELEE